ncbi:MAG: gliding motility protein GldL [Prevotella sp.]|nr:gliding motility protein GldL [Prevotella sp.]
MTKYSKFNIIYRLQKWLDSVPGQTFMNYAYSWGASIVILGTLFKLTHLSGANFMLFLGMGTEVVVFFIAAFDRPFDKTADGMDLPTHAVNEGEVEEVGRPCVSGTGSGIISTPELPELNPDMEEVTNNYVDQLKKLTDTLQKVSEQSERLTRDSEEMENLNRTLTGICKVYEMQLKGASKQIGTIDQINEQSKRMAEQIAELNKIYTRMIEAMTVNMPKGI